MSFVGKAIGSLTGANKQAKAAKQAAQTQSDATKYASDIQKEMYEQTRSDLNPYTQAGTNALSQLVGLTNNNQSYSSNPFNYNGSGSTSYTSSPFSYNGQSQYSSSPFSFEESPSYQYRKEQGMNGIQSSAAASGGLLSGATLKALNNYNSNLASEEYQNSFNNYLNQEQLNQSQQNQAYNQYLNTENLNANNFQNAFNNWQSQDNNAYSRYQTDQNNQYNQLYNLVGLGQNSAAQTASAGQSTAQAIANNTMAGANATAAGQVAAGNYNASNMQNLLGLGTSIAGLFI